MRRAAKVDDNQAALVALWRKHGATVDIVSAVPMLGYDVILGYMGVTVLVEIKDGEKPPSRRALTESEEVARARWGKTFAVVENETEALGLLYSMSEHRVGK